MDKVTAIFYIFKLGIPSFAGSMLFLISIRKWIHYESSRNFDINSKESDLAYKLYDKTKDYRYARLGEELGMSALFGNISLEKENQSDFFKSVSPGKDLHALRKCNELVKFSKSGPALFEWKCRAYSSKVIRHFLMAVCSIVYLLSFFPILFMTLGYFKIYQQSYPSWYLSRFLTEPLVSQVLGWMFLGVGPLYLGCVALIHLMRMQTATELIERNINARKQKPSYFIKRTKRYK